MLGPAPFLNPFRGQLSFVCLDTVSRCLITSMLVHVPSLVVAVVVLFFMARRLRRQARWYRVMILALGARGPGSNPGRACDEA